MQETVFTFLLVDLCQRDTHIAGIQLTRLGDLWVFGMIFCRTQSTIDALPYVKFHTHR